MPSESTGLSRWRDRVGALFQDHEIFVRTDGQVRFLHVSAVWQKRVAVIVGAVVLAWATITAAMLINQALTVGDRIELTRQQAAVAKSEANVAKYRGRIAETAADLSARQAQLEEMVDEHLVPVNAVTADPAKAKPAAEKSSADAVVSDASMTRGLPPEARKLAQLEKQQDSFARRLLVAVNARAAKAEQAVAKLGFNPGKIVANAASGRGGPFIPYRNNRNAGAGMSPTFSALERALFRMEALERTLVAIPSGNPANVLMMSSGFGYRSDPFNGRSAMHAGLDFRGPIGTPILAAAPGKVVFVGQRSGYGNVVEVDHGQGILTRYAHLSAFTTKVGAKVTAGEQIAKMGSTGRSTGSHLHFEVRLNGVPVNPRRFLEANADVLEVKAVARQRVGALALAAAG